MSTVPLGSVGWGIGGLTILVLIFAAVLLLRRREPAPPAAEERVAQSTGIAADPLVSARLRAHRDEFLAYELGLAVARSGHSLELRDELLAGATPVLAAPVLELSDLLATLGQETSTLAVKEALEELGVAPATDTPGLRVAASVACQRWAEKVADTRLRAWREAQDG